MSPGLSASTHDDCSAADFGDPDDGLQGVAQQVPTPPLLGVGAQIDVHREFAQPPGRHRFRPPATHSAGRSVANHLNGVDGVVPTTRSRTSVTSRSRYTAQTPACIELAACRSATRCTRARHSRRPPGHTRGQLDDSMGAFAHRVIRECTQHANVLSSEYVMGSVQAPHPPARLSAGPRAPERAEAPPRTRSGILHEFSIPSPRSRIPDAAQS
jgi:hypothetical protein